MAVFKYHIAIWFYQGVFLGDKRKFLFAAGDETRALRQWRFSSNEEIVRELDTIVEYVQEAIENHKMGKKISPVKNRPFTIPAELKNALDDDPYLKECYHSLSHSKQRDYANYIANAKQYTTRIRRIQKCVPMIKNMVGLSDRYS